MSDFNCIVRIPTHDEYDWLMDTANENDAVTHWNSILSLVYNPEFTTEHSGRKEVRGYHSARGWDSFSDETRAAIIGFRPTFEPSDDTLSADIVNGKKVIVGTLYMDNKPVKIPQTPTHNGDIPDYIPGTKLEFKQALEDPAYQVQAVYAEGVFVCDRCLLKNISYNDITANLKNDMVSSFTPSINSQPVSLTTAADVGSSIYKYEPTAPEMAKMAETDNIEQNIILHFIKVGSSKRQSKEVELKTCYGDLCVIINALYDYANMLEKAIQEREMAELSTAIFQLHAERCRKIAGKYSAAIGYDYDKALEHCRKRREKGERRDDTGMDGLEASVQKRRDTTKKTEGNLDTPHS